MTYLLNGGVPCNWVRELTCSRPCGDIGEAADPYVPTPPRLGLERRGIYGKLSK